MEASEEDDSEEDAPPAPFLLQTTTSNPITARRRTTLNAVNACSADSCVAVAVASGPALGGAPSALQVLRENGVVAVAVELPRAEGVIIRAAIDEHISAGDICAARWR